MAQETDRRRIAAIFAALALPFYLNDFANIWVTSWQWWLTIDYLFVKLLPLAAIAWLVRSAHLQAADFGLVRQTVPAFVVTFLLLAFIGTLLDQNGYKLVAALPGYKALGGMPEITSAFWDRFDLTAGLFVVGVLEEVIFRGLAHSVLTRFTDNRVVIVVTSALAFGFIHWSLGLHAVIVTGVIGAVFMLAYQKTRSTPAIILAHFMVNFIDYAGVIPKTAFQLI